MTRDTIDRAEAGIEDLVARKFGVKSGGLRDKLRRAAGRMPRAARQAVARDVAYLEAARKRTAHPRRRGQLDHARVARMVAEHERRLEKVDVARDRARDRLNWLGGLVLNLMMFALAYFALLKWLGAI